LLLLWCVSNADSLNPALFASPPPFSTFFLVSFFRPIPLILSTNIPSYLWSSLPLGRFYFTPLPLVPTWNLMVLLPPILLLFSFFFFPSLPSPPATYPRFSEPIPREWIASKGPLASPLVPPILTALPLYFFVTRSFFQYLCGASCFFPCSPTRPPFTLFFPR